MNAANEVDDLFHDIEAAQFKIEDSDEDDQFSLVDMLAQADKTEADYRIKNKSKVNATISRDDESEQHKTPQAIDTVELKPPENRPAKTIQNFFAQNINETQEKRSRPSLLDCLEEDYRKSPAKMKCNVKTPTRTKISPVNLSEKISSPVLATTSAQSTSSIGNGTQKEKLDPENAPGASTAEYEDEEMHERTKTPTMTEDHPVDIDKSDSEAANTSNSHANKSKVIVSPKQQKINATTPKSMKKERAFMDNYFKRSTPTSGQKAISERILSSEQDEVTEMDIDTFIDGEALDSEINHETDQLKALHVASDQVILNIEDSPVIT